VRAHCGVIVFDENIDEKLVLARFAERYKGLVISLRSLRPRSVIKDDAVPELLLRTRSPVFVTINVKDFWMRIAAHPGYCIACVPLATSRQGEIPRLLLRFLRHRSFRTSSKRMGKIVRLGAHEICFYARDRKVEKVPWS
jgi:hypothetical protein